MLKNVVKFRTWNSRLATSEKKKKNGRWTSILLDMNFSSTTIFITLQMSQILGYSREQKAKIYIASRNSSFLIQIKTGQWNSAVWRTVKKLFWEGVSVWRIKPIKFSKPTFFELADEYRARTNWVPTVWLITFGSEAVVYGIWRKKNYRKMHVQFYRMAELQS